MIPRAATFVAASLVSMAACALGDPPPTEGTVTMQFPSTQAAIVTDFVQLFVFDIQGDEQRASICDEKLEARRRGEALGETLQPRPWNICELLAGRRRVTIPYGDKAILAVAQRRDVDNQIRDFMIGCAVQTVGERGAPVPVSLALVDADAPLPETECATVEDYCDGRCQ